jgi:hypothetical protein
VAGKLAARASIALEKMHDGDADEEIEWRFRQLRRALIAAIKEQRHRAPLVG